MKVAPAPDAEGDVQLVFFGARIALVLGLGVPLPADDLAVLASLAVEEVFGEMVLVLVDGAEGLHILVRHPLDNMNKLLFGDSGQFGEVDVEGIEQPQPDSHLLPGGLMLNGLNFLLPHFFKIA